MKKLALILAVALLFSAIPTYALAEEPVTISFMEVLSSDARSEWMDQKIAAFEAEHPSIKVVREIVPWEQAHDKLVTLKAANQLPDVLETSDNWLSEFAASGAYLSLEDYYSKWEHNGEIADMCLKLGRMYENTLYDIPYGLYICTMLYRADWLKEKGIEAPATIDAYYQAMADVTDAAKGQYGYAFRGGAGCWGLLSMLILGEIGSGDYFEEDGKTSVFRRPEAAEALQHFGDVYFNGYAPADALNWGYAETVDAFTSGIACFLVQDTEVIGIALDKLERDQLGTAMAPAGKDGKTYLIGGQMGLSIAANSAHPDEAWEFLSYMLSPEVNAEWAQIGWIVPTNKQALENPSFSDSYMAPVSQAIVSDDVVLYSHPSYLPEWGEFYASVAVDEVQGFLLKDQTAEETMNNISDYLEEAQANYLAGK